MHSAGCTFEYLLWFPQIPEPTKNTDWMHFSLDYKTANMMLWISDNVFRRTEEVCPVLDRPEKYEYSPQVCQNIIQIHMRAYWEVEYSGADSGPSGLGENEESWGLCWSGTRYQIWFNGMNKDINDIPNSSTIGVHIDQPAGIMSFYVVPGEGEERELLFKVQTTIKKKGFTGFWMGIQSSCTILETSD
uniref:Uncharacterized protein n=1 Tax=Cyclopterus lumpus TaxID=8103 RepID=A0A8C2Z9Q1_CYCLU